MIDRILGPQLKKLAERCPIVSVTGPRQSGKSTLVQAAFPDYLYVNLEEPAVRARALADPTGFVATLPERPCQGARCLDQSSRVLCYRSGGSGTIPHLSAPTSCFTETTAK